jgi:tRNA modification GTPase
LEVQADFGGIQVIFADTAGLRETEDVIEQEGVRRAEKAASEAELRLIVLDGADSAPLDGRIIALADENNSLIILNKNDLSGDGRKAAEMQRLYPGRVIAISAKTGLGLPNLMEILGKAIEARLDHSSEAPVLSRLRYRQALERCSGHLARFLEQADAYDTVELAAEDLRMAAREIGRITGRVDIEEILDIVFREFCIGK